MKKNIILNQTQFIATVVFLIMTIFLSACRRDTDTTTPLISCTDINSDVVWTDRGDGVDYILNCVVSVNAKLTIDPGVTIQVKSGGGIIVETTGSFLAQGSSVENIIFKGEQDVAGVWKGIYIKSNNVLNEINYCQISNGGSSSFDGNLTKVASIRVALTAQLILQNSTISKSGKDGLLVDGFDTDELNPITLFANNSFVENLNYPISALGAIATELDGDSSTYVGNSKNKILLRGGRLFGTHNWKKMNVPYLIESVVSVGYYTNDGNLTLDPGVTVQFAADAGLCTGDYSTGSWMRIEGSSPTNIITLTGETASPGSWKGIAFQSLSVNNRISQTIVSYGGSSSYTGNTSQRGNIMAGAWSAGNFTIDNSNVTNSSGYGVYATLPSPAITLPSSMFFSGNASGNYYHE